MSGHYPPEIGRAMEDSFVGLLYRLGYAVLRTRDVASGLDVIAEFYGEPLNPKTSNPCKLLLPSFAPKELTAFSLKRGDFSSSDIEELIEKVQRARNSDDTSLSKVEGMAIVSNFFKLEREIDEALAKNVYCWDSRRLLFYSTKARLAQELASRGPTSEIAILGVGSSSYLIQTETSKELGNVISANVAVLVDDHSKELVVSSDHIEKILRYIYETSLKGIVEYSHLEVQVAMEIHLLGIAQENLVRASYNEYAAKRSSHPSVFFSAKPIIFQYGAAPWATLFFKREFVR